MDQNQIIERFKILDIQGPKHQGSLDQFHDYYLKLVYDPGSPLHKIGGIVVVRFFDSQYLRLAYGNPEEPPHDSEAKSRVGYYVIEKLKSILGVPGAPTDYSFQATSDEINTLREIDSRRIDVKAWQEVVNSRELYQDQVFISCGQQTDGEIRLGQQIVKVVEEQTGLKGYFAQNQQSLEGVTLNIFQAIYNSAAFIAVMHRRDLLSNETKVYRGSVWVEQEIAIASFVVQVLGAKVPNRAFIQSGIKREGVRGFIHLNATEFENNEEGLTAIEKWLPSLELPIQHS